MTAANRNALLSVENLSVEFGDSRVVDDISFAVEAGRTVAIVGESGSGKSVTSLSTMRLADMMGATYPAGRIMFEGKDLLKASQKEMRSIRGKEIAMIFQEPMTSLNPVFTVGEQVAEAVRLHQRKSAAEARAVAIEMFELVGIPDPAARVDAYPHQLSGGLRQRVMIAMALACKPDLLIADEPTTALDVTIQAQILDLMRTLQEETGTAIMLITHDLGVVAEVADEVAVMYCGRIVERAPVRTLFAEPQHPYTVGLLGSVPRLDGAAGRLASAPRV